VNCVVTGGAKGIGRATAQRLLRHGGIVVVVDTDADALAWTAEYDRAAPVRGSAADAEIAEEAARRARPLHAWVNNAAVFQDARLHQDAEAVRAAIEINLQLALTGCATAIRHFLEDKTPGAIVNVTSHQATRPVPGSLPYATAKAAIEGLTRALAVDYGPYGIRVNAVAPGSVDTGREDARTKDLAELHALNRIGTPAEVAQVIESTLQATFVTGATIPVDGGRGVLNREPG
jgi:NAD(P)-dependent dehydrogenase (short-subunit alcohol dehydrogenase family)